MTDIDNELIELVERDFDTRGRVWPTVEEAFLWINTELAEAIDVWMSKKTWVRNNPQNHPPYDGERFAKELGDIIYMLMVIASVAEVYPIDAMKRKYEEKIRKHIETINVSNSV